MGDVLAILLQLVKTLLLPNNLSKDFTPENQMQYLINK